MSRKMKQIMLAVILMVMMCAVSPARKVSAEVLNSPQQIVWVRVTVVSWKMHRIHMSIHLR
jgi:hypothetical protein